MKLVHALCPVAVLAVAATPASGYKVQGPSFDREGGPVPFHLEPNGSDDVTDGSDLDEVRAAFRMWSCVEGSGLRFLESLTPGERQESLTDGRNNVFWDEDGSFGLGPGTFSITKTTPYVPGQPAVRDNAEIIFNGFDHRWATGTPSDADRLPIFNVALREIGVVLGLEAECTVEDDPNTCPGPETSVMSPFIPNAPREGLRDDDVAGVLALYETSDGSSCTGPYRQGEPCQCDGECVEGMICATGGEGRPVCSPLCSSDDVTCPPGFACVLSAATSDDEAARGQCVQVPAGSTLPLAAACDSDRQCSDGLCASVPSIGRSACRVSCETDDECPDAYVCSEGHCTWKGNFGGNPCADGSCSCDGTSGTPAVGPWLGALAFLIGWYRRRRSQR
ncbi:MAG: MYXO-CTERM sorting domain-containing protein [Myxococcota bacterium]